MKTKSRWIEAADMVCEHRELEKPLTQGHVQALKEAANGVNKEKKPVRLHTCVELLSKQRTGKAPNIA
eukprot:12928443-Prorocentrum_lima.AAC.1